MITVTESDITTYGKTRDIDVVVNSANPFLGGIGKGLPENTGGVDGAIHRAAGIELLHACEALERFPGVTRTVIEQLRCSHGDLRITESFGLPYKKIFHGVAPIYVDGSFGELLLLETLYDRIFQTLIASGYQSIVLPAMGTRSYGMPKAESAEIAVRRASHYFTQNQIHVHFALFEHADYELYQSLLSAPA